MIRPKGLGRGLDALLAGTDEAAPSGDQLQTISIDRLRPGKYQPRTRMDQQALAELAASIRTQGLMQPLLVRPVASSNGRDQYELIAGERRWRAAQLAGLTEVPALVRDVQDSAALAMALIENIQREDLNPIDEALAYQRLSDDFHLTQEAIATAVGKDRASVANHMRLLKLPEEVRAEVAGGRVAMGHARALLALESEAEQLRICRDVIARSLSVRARSTPTSSPVVNTVATSTSSRATPSASSAGHSGA